MVDLKVIMALSTYRVSYFLREVTLFHAESTGLISNVVCADINSHLS